MTVFFQTLRECWRINRNMTLATLIDEIKMHSDNPYRNSYDATDGDLMLGAERYLLVEHRDHPEKFDTATQEETDETERLSKVIAFKDMTPEEKTIRRREIIAQARIVRLQNIARRRDEGR
jgi:hypothetical protein